MRRLRGSSRILFVLVKVKGIGCVIPIVIGAIRRLADEIAILELNGNIIDDDVRYVGMCCLF